jgi:hypothetical protein
MALLAVAVGCQSIANLETRKSDPLPAAGSCSLPSSGNGSIRLANVANVAGNPDFCIRTTGASDWGRPVFRDGGDSWSSTPDPLCSGGLPRTVATVPFNVPAGKIDVKAIPAGQTCAAAATSEIDGATVGDSTQGAPVVTIMRYGGDKTPEAMSALPEEPAASVSAVSTLYFRVINAVSDTRSIDFGRAAGSTLPTTVSNPILKLPVPPGGIEPVGTTTEGKPVDASGYAQTLPLSFSYGVSFDGDTTNKAVVLFQTGGNADVATLYVVGEPGGGNKYALRGLYCPDSGSVASRSTGSADAGASASAAVAGLSHQDLALVQQCTPTALPLLSVDTFNTALYGANAPYETDRRTAVYNAIAGRTSDLMCLVEVDDASDRTAIVAATQGGQYPYSYSVTTSATDDPTNQADVHPTPSTPPCSGVDVSAAIACANTNCSTDPNNPTNDGHLNGSTNCLSSQCAAPFVPIYTSHQACFDCLVYYLTSLQPIASAQSACTGDDHQPFAFNGQTPSMILSHYPLANTKAYILPATGFRRAVLKAQVTLEDQTVDFFCAQVTSPLLDNVLPYTGYYGSDTGPQKNGWEDEQDLQASEAVKWIKQEAQTDGFPAIIAGDWHSTVACTAGSTASCPPGGLSPLSPEVATMLDKGLQGPFTRADPSGYVRVCDYCPVPTNVYNTNQQSWEYTPTYLFGFPADSTTSESLWDTGNNIPITGTPQNPPPTGGMGAIAEVFPRNVQILRPH